MPQSPPEFQVAVVRLILLITKLTRKKADKGQVKQRFKSVFRAIHSGSIAFSYFVNFLMSDTSKIEGLKHVFFSLKIETLEHVEVFSKLAVRFGPFPSILRLVKAGLSDKLLHRACFQSVLSLIADSPNAQDVRDWMTICVRRLLLFVVISTGRQKYRFRSLLICETLSLFSSSSISWLQQSILASAAALLGTRSLPRYFTTFFMLSSSPDDSSLSEYESFVQQSMVLKCFPFEPNRLALLIPVVPELHGLPPIQSCRSSISRVKITAKKKKPRARWKTMPVIKVPKLNFIQTK
jgi:hypothetical protein